MMSGCETGTVFVSGNFNVLHPGHLRLLHYAKQLGTRLVVGLLADDAHDAAAIVPGHLRLEAMKSLGCVDEAFIIDGTLESVIRQIRPEYVLKGKEHESQYNLEEEVVSEYGGKLVFSSGEVVFSSLELIRAEYAVKPEGPQVRIPKAYCERHSLSLPALRELVQSFAALKICVIGDLIIDEYITCQPLGMSQEDPTIVVTPLDSKLFLGGAGIVAAHAAALGGDVTFFSVVGNDKAGVFARERLKEYGVKSVLLTDDTRPTTLKQRFRSKGKTLLRVSHLRQEAISAKLQKQLLKKVNDELQTAQLIIFSDFNYGVLPQPLADKLTTQAAQRGVVSAADSQSSSQTGDVSRFRNMSLLTPTEREARLATRNNEDGLVVLAESLRKQSEAHHILLKLGEEGLLIHGHHDTGEDFITDRLPALNEAPKDVAGAGDSLLTASAMTLAAGGNIWDAALMGSIAAAIQVDRVGNIPINKTSLLKTLMSGLG